jgi:AraC-like DNA-binding protein
MAEAVALPIKYDREGRSAAIMKLIGYEVGRLRELPLSLPLPTDKALARRCLKFSASPKAHAKIDDWASSLHLTRRTFTRLFRRETGLSFVAWRQQACILAALPKLTAGASSGNRACGLLPVVRHTGRIRPRPSCRGVSAIVRFHRQRMWSGP